MFTTALAITLLAGLSTGLGGVLVALKGDIGDRFLAGSLEFSAGVMIYISLVELLPESMEALDNDWFAIAAFFFGVALIAVIDRLVPDDINPHEPSTSTAPQATTLRRAGLMTGIAIALHNFPEGLCHLHGRLHRPEARYPDRRRDCTPQHPGRRGCGGAAGAPPAGPPCPGSRNRRARSSALR